jgi:hypothetical protein
MDAAAVNASQTLWPARGRFVPFSVPDLARSRHETGVPGEMRLSSQGDFVCKPNSI